MSKTPTIQISELSRDQYEKVLGMVKEMNNAMIQMDSLKDFQKDIKVRCKEEVGLKDSDFKFLVDSAYDSFKMKEKLSEIEDRVSKAQEMGILKFDEE